MNAVTHLEKVITGEVSAVTHLEKVIAGETSAVTYTEKVITGEAPPITHLQKVIAGEASPVTHLEYVWVGGTPSPTEHEYTGAVPYTFNANGSPLISWRISGNTVQFGTPTPDSPIMPQGTGERTGNLFDKDNATIYSLYPGTGNTIKISSNARSIAIPCEGGEIYTVSKKPGERFIVCFTTEPIASQVAYTDAVTDNRAASITVAAPSNAKFLFVYFYNSMVDVGTAETIVNSIMINTGSTPLPYEPYGYKIPVISAGQTFDVYIGAEPLRKAIDGSNVADTIIYSTQQLIRKVDSSGNALATPTTETVEVPELPTNNGSTTIDVNTTLKPSKVYIKYKGV